MVFSDKNNRDKIYISHSYFDKKDYKVKIYFFVTDGISSKEFVYENPFKMDLKNFKIFKNCTNNCEEEFLYLIECKSRKDIQYKVSVFKFDMTAGSLNEFSSNIISDEIYKGKKKKKGVYYMGKFNETNIVQDKNTNDLYIVNTYYINGYGADIIITKLNSENSIQWNQYVERKIRMDSQFMNYCTAYPVSFKVDENNLLIYDGEQMQPKPSRRDPMSKIVIEVNKLNGQYKRVALPE